MIEHSAVAAEQEAKSSKNDADFTGNISAILVFVFCESNTGEKKKESQAIGLRVSGSTLPHAFSIPHSPQASVVKLNPFITINTFWETNYLKIEWNNGPSGKRVERPQACMPMRLLQEALSPTSCRRQSSSLYFEQGAHTKNHR